MRQKIKQYISLWQNRCYSELPDEAPSEIDDMVPSYKRICIAILKNDLSHIGIEPPKSEYYGILKCIELNKIYKKSKTMTQQETKELVFSITNQLASKQGYIKGFGEKFRVMDKDHNPLMNITKQVFNVLKFNGVIYLEGLVYKPNDFNPPFKHAVDVKLPSKFDEA
jgi:hypothetical protein